MHRFARLLLLLGSVFILVAMSGPTAWLIVPAEAGTTTGTAVTVSGLDTLANTVDTYSKGNVGKMLGIGLGIGGMLLMGGGRVGLGGMAATAGLGAAFVPNIIGTAFDSTAAAPLVATPVLAPLTPWWVPVLGLLYPGMLALRLLQDPVVLAALALASVLVRAARRTHALRQGVV
jgi:hypothetical protein